MKIATFIATAFAFAAATSLCQASVSAASDGAYHAALPLYADPQGPLDVQREGTGTFAGGRWGKITYAGFGGERVPALITLPDSATKDHPVPCLLLLHGLGGNKEMLEPLAQTLASAGYASLAIDEAGLDQRSPGVEFPSFASIDDLTKAIVNGSVETVVDLRRGLDYLQGRPDIAKGRVGLIGFSLGAIQGTLLAGNDTRVKAVVLVSGGGGLAKILLAQAQDGQSLGAQYAPLLKGVGEDDLEAKLAPVDPINFVAHITPRPLLMEHGRNDIVIPPDDAQALYDTAGQPKQIVWFADAGHIPSQLEMYPSISLFLQTYLPV